MPFPTRRTTNLSVPPTPLLGRSDTMQTARTVLRRDDVQLLTLTGPGGVGKTRLALEIAGTFDAERSMHVAFVAGGVVADAPRLLAAITQALGGGEGNDDLVAQLRAVVHEPTLLVLDNLEHLLHVAPQIAAVLAAVPLLTVLATSRAPLRIAAESVLPVPPLALPDLGTIGDPIALAHIPAVALFLQRARSIDPRFQLTEHNARSVAAICVGLDGLPLAIELAAARIRLLNASMIAQRLDQRLHLLTSGDRDLPARQQTLRATIDWSYDLLASHEQYLFACCAVFVGSFSLHAAEAVAHEQQEPTTAERYSFIIEALSALVDHSLVQRIDEAADEARFRLLETIRVYARERLVAHGSYHDIAERHGRYFLALAEANQRETTGVEQRTAFQRLQSEYDNLRAALDWFSSTNNGNELLRFVGALRHFWEAYDYLSEGRHWAERGLALATDPLFTTRAQAYGVVGTLARHQGDYAAANTAYAAALSLWEQFDDTAGRADVLWGLGEVAFRQGVYPAAQAYFAASRDLNERARDQHGFIDALNGLGRVAWAQGNGAEAEHLHREALAICRGIDYPQGTAWTLNALGETARGRGDYTAAETLLNESAAQFRASGNRGAHALASQNLAFVQLHTGAWKRAHVLFQETLACWRVGGARHGIALSLVGLAGVALIAGQGEQGARLLGAAQPLLDATGIALDRTDRVDYERITAAIAAQVGADRLLALGAAGQHSDLDTLLGALDTEAGAYTKTIAAVPFGLTKREVDVLRLLAAGLTNAQIAERLVISPFTVNIHARSIYGKLGVATRAAATRRALEAGLV